MAQSQRLSAFSSLHRKQISIESRVEQVVSMKEEDGEEEEDGTLKKIDSVSKVSVVISSEAKRDTYMSDEVDTSDPVVCHTQTLTISIPRKKHELTNCYPKLELVILQKSTTLHLPPSPHHHHSDSEAILRTPFLCSIIPPLHHLFRSELLNRHPDRHWSILLSLQRFPGATCRRSYSSPLGSHDHVWRVCMEFAGQGCVF